MAYARREDENRSRALLVKQVATGSEVTVARPQTGWFAPGYGVLAGATFTPDGNYLYLHAQRSGRRNQVTIQSIGS